METAWQQVTGMATGGEADGSYLQQKARNRENKLEVAGGFEALNPTPGTHFLQQGHTSQAYTHRTTSWGSNAQVPQTMGDTSFTPPQRDILFSGGDADKLL